MRAAARRREPIPLPVALEILAQAAQGLDDAHEATTPTGVHLGIVHRDVSPQNLLVGIDGRTRVTDFGIARALMRRTSTSTGELKGKIAYFSPEQARGKEVDRRSDVFALGVVAWEAITGHRLFGNDEALRTLQRVLEQPIVDARTLRPDLPLAAARAIDKALSRDLATRFQSAADFAVALRDAAREVSAPASSREIGRWVADLAGEPLRAMRERIDAALVAKTDVVDAPAPVDVLVDTDDDAATRVLGAQSVASGVMAITRTAPTGTPSPASSDADSGSLAKTPVPTPTATAPLPPSDASSGASSSESPSSMPRPSTPIVAARSLASASLASPDRLSDEPSADEVAALRGNRRGVKLAIGGVAVAAAVGAVFWLGRVSSVAPAEASASAASAVSSEAPPPLESPRAEATIAPAQATAAPAGSAATERASADVTSRAAKDTPARAVVKPSGRAASTAANGDAPEAPPATAAAAPAPKPPVAPKTAAAPPTAAPKPASTGPLLGDDDFNRDVSRMR
jgi:serine/threonine-protein kinase